MTVANYYMKTKLTTSVEEKEILQYDGLCLKPGMVIKRRRTRETSLTNSKSQEEFFIVLRVKVRRTSFVNNFTLIILECLGEDSAPQNIVFSENDIVQTFYSDYEIYSNENQVENRTSL